MVCIPAATGAAVSSSSHVRKDVAKSEENAESSIIHSLDCSSLFLGCTLRSTLFSCLVLFVATLLFLLSGITILCQCCNPIDSWFLCIHQFASHQSVENVDDSTFDCA